MDVVSDFADSSYHQDPPGRKAKRRVRRGQSTRPVIGDSRITAAMSARQNKKQRKGRNSANNRERTVTTLTEDPNTPYLVPTPSEEPPSSHLSAHLGSKAHNSPMGSQPYQMSSNFGGFQGYAGTFNPQQQPYFPPSQSPTMQQQSSQQYPPTPPLPPGKNDLEILQNLKQVILDNQHPIFRAIPKPTALAKLYKGPLPASQPQGGIESGETSNADFLPATPDSGSLATRIQSKDSSSVPPASGNRQNSPRNLYHNSSGNNTISDATALVHRVGKSVSSGGSHSEVRSTVLPVFEEDHEGRYQYPTRHRAQQSDSAPMADRVGYPSNGIKKQSLDNPMDGVEAHGNKDKPPRSDSWTSKQATAYSEIIRPGLDRTPTSRGGAVPLPAVPSGHPDTRPTTAVFDPPSDIRDHDRGPNPDSRGWSWQDRNHRRPDYDRPHLGRQQSYHRPRRMSAASDHHRPVVDDPPVRRGGPVVEPSQSHVPVDSRGPSTDVVRPPAASDRPLHVSDESVVDSKRSVYYHLDPDARVPPLLSRLEGHESDAVPSTRPGDTLGSRVALAPASSSLASPDPLVQDPGPRQSTNDTAGGGGGGDLPAPPSRANSRPFPHHGIHKKKFQKNHPHGAGPNTQGATYGNPASDHPPPRSGQGRPPSPSLPASGASRPLHPRSASVEGRRARFPSPVGGSRVWDNRGPPGGRDISRDRPPAGYRGDYEPDINPMRYGDSRPYGRDYSPPPPTHSPPFPPGERGPPGTYPSPSSGVSPGRDWGGYAPSYLPGNRRDWSAAEEEAYIKSRTWEGRPPPPPPPPPSERDRYDYPPRSANWVERDYPGRDSYPPGPPPPVDDRYNDRTRPPPSVYPPYNRVTRPRSPSPPLRRGGPDSLDDRPPVKRPREEYDPVDYYPPPTTTGRRGGHPPEYPHPPPPRTGSPGPPGSGPSWPPPPSSGSSGGPAGGAGLPSDRDYRYPPPVSGGYDRPRSPGPSRGRPPYSRGGGYGRDGGRNTYPPRP